MVDRTTLGGNTATGGAGGAGGTGDPTATLNGFPGGTGGAANGAAICNLGSLWITRSTLVSNVVTCGAGGAGGSGAQDMDMGGKGARGGDGGSGLGGALFNSGAASLVNCTIAFNTGSGGAGGSGGWGAGYRGLIGDGGAGGNGGSGFGGVDGTCNLVNCTLAWNLGQAGSGGAGAAALKGNHGAPGTSGGACGGTACGPLVNTLIVSNTPAGGDSFTDPKLGPLANNGGPTLTMALLPGSPAIDAGDTAAAPPTDQRGFPRPAGLAADIGAFEYGSVMQPPFSYTTNNSTITITGYWGLDGAATIPDTINGLPVSSIGTNAFLYSSLTSVMIPNSVTSIGDGAFYHCTSLSSVTISNGVTSIGNDAFYDCTSLTNITIPNSVTSIGSGAFSSCSSLTGVYFKGNAPSLGGSSVFTGITNATVYYLAGTTGWGATFGGLPTALWNPPAILMSPQTQTAEAGSVVELRVKASGSSPLFCLWYLNDTNLMSCSTNQELELTNVQFAQSGTYTVVVTNGAGAVTSAPAMLNVIAAVERRPAAGVKVMGEAGSLLNVDYANSLSATPNWLPLDTVTLASTSQYCFDVTQPLPPQRFYRAWQTGTPGILPSLSLLGIAPAITLTGSIGHSVRVDYINQFGPIDAWVTLATVTLTNTSQLYFDVSALGQPQRLYRVVQVP
jgi:hypothetical protein